MPAKKTNEEIEALKRQWLHDPIWDIEETEGYEAHRGELLKFREQQELEWVAVRAQQQLKDVNNRQELVVRFATNVGLDNIKLATVLYGMREKQACLDEDISTFKQLFIRLNDSVGDTLQTNPAWQELVKLVNKS